LTKKHVNIIQENYVVVFFLLLFFYQSSVATYIIGLLKAINKTIIMAIFDQHRKKKKQALTIDYSFLS